MARRTLAKFRTRGKVLIERFAGVTMPAEVKTALKQFTTMHGAYEAMSAKVDAAEEKRDLALENVGKADKPLDRDVDGLADDFVGAGLTKRNRPFAGIASKSPSEIANLAYRKEVEAVRELVKQASKLRGITPAIQKRLAALTKGADAVDAALLGLVGPQSAYDKALRDRDAILPDWVKAERRLRKKSDAAWADDPATYASLFAPIEGIQAPKKAPSKKAVAAKKARKKGEDKTKPE